MNNVVLLRKLNSRPLSFATDDRRGFELKFFLGVMVFVLLPQIVAVNYYGLLLAELLSISALVGIGLGLVMRFLFPYRIQELGIDIRFQINSDTQIVTKLAA